MNSEHKSNKRMRYTRQSIVSNTFCQMPRFLMAGEFSGNKLSNNARILYTLLHDRHQLSVKNSWFDDNGEVYIYFKREEMEALLGISDRTISKVMQELKDLLLVEEKKQGLNRPNKIYLLSPVIDNGESPDPYITPDYDYDPEKSDEHNYDTEPEITTASESKDLRVRTRKNFASEPEENDTSKGENSSVQDPKELRPNYNNLNNKKKKDNELNDNEENKTTATDGNAETQTDSPLTATAAAEAETQDTNTADNSTPYSQILKTYNEICKTHGLRPIRSIDGKRKSQTAARFKEYGIDGFIDLFEKTANSVFLCGGGSRGWKADFDWLIAPSNMPKVLEGKYNDDQSNTPLQPIMVDEPCQTTFYSNQQKNNKQERADPFLERALTAYATAVNTIQTN